MKPVETEGDMRPLSGLDKAGVLGIAEQGITGAVGLLLSEASMTEAPVVTDQGKIAVEVPALSAVDRIVLVLAVERRPVIEVKAGGHTAGSAAPLIEEHRLAAAPLPVAQLQGWRRDLLGRVHRVGKVPVVRDHHKAHPGQHQTDPFWPQRKLVLAACTHC